MSELNSLGVRELARAIAAREVSPVDVVKTYLARIEKLDGRFRCYLDVFADTALNAARAAEATVGRSESGHPLNGVPIAVKDLFAVKDTPTTAGSRFLNEPAAADCSVVARLRAAGAIILGKLNLHEFAYGPEGINLHHGTPWNPWDVTTHRMPGGSSSGSAVAVATGLAPAAMGSDTGGSIRIPAACCGTVGLKPTYGRVSRAGILPLSWSLDHAGPLTRRVEDAATILTAIAGRDPADPSSAGVPVEDYAAGLSASVRGHRIGLFSEYVEQAESQVQEAMTAAVRDFERLGCSVQEIALPKARYALGASYAIAGPEALAFHRPLLRQHASEYAPDVRRRLLAGGFPTAADYVKGQQARRLLRDEINRVLQNVDCILAPTLPIPAPPVSATEVKIGGRTESARLALTMFTRLFNVSGHPVVCLPCGFSREGLPLSLQLVGRAFDEATILRLAHAYEMATEWHRRRPPGV
jgi:aspartyl-tRNA(Asn)/glutamyl-tRNA(Gln) amidotransferase subunit A